MEGDGSLRPHASRNRNGAGARQPSPPSLLTIKNRVPLDPQRADVADLSRPHGFRSIEKSIEDPHPRSDHVALYADYYESESKSWQVVLERNLSVDCHKHVESTFGVAKELFILTSIPSDLGHKSGWHDSEMQLARLHVRTRLTCTQSSNRIRTRGDDPSRGRRTEPPGRVRPTEIP